MISGYVDQQENIARIVQISQEYYPKVINNMTISGVQQVLLHVKVMEVSRTKLRNLGFDFAKVTNGSLVTSGIAGLISAASSASTGSAGVATAQTVKSGTVNLALFSGNSSFFAVLDALREDRLAKILAEPNLVTISGRPAYFLAGGELGYQTSSGLTGTNVEFKQYGTRVDVVPIVLGNGRIRLEVRPSVSEPDAANSAGGIPSAGRPVKWTPVWRCVPVRRWPLPGWCSSAWSRPTAVCHGSVKCPTWVPPSGLSKKPSTRSSC